MTERSRTKLVAPGSVVGQRYEVVRLIARGGMGSVYLGRQIGLGRHVAIKTLLPHLADSPDFLARFRRETEAVQRLTHPNTVRVYDVGETPDGLPYLVMEHLDGEMLSQVLAAVGCLPVPTVVHIGHQVLGSLVEAHAHGIVHRDIKPSNLMLCRQLGAPNLVKVLDFGLAWTDPEFKNRPVAVGTPHYASPEQLTGGRVDGRSDLYSLGLTLLELATGKSPFEGMGTFDIAEWHLSDAPLQLPRELVGTSLGDAILRAVQRRPDHRFASASKMLAALPSKEGALDSVLDRVDSGARPVAHTEQGLPNAVHRLTTEDLTRIALARRRSKRRRRFVPLALAAALVTWLLVSSDRAPDHATRLGTQSGSVAARVSGSAELGGGGSSRSRAEAVAPAGAPAETPDVRKPEGAGSDGADAEQRASARPLSALRRQHGAGRTWLVVDSQPPGATARLGDGRCVTPCKLAAPGGAKSGELILSLDGHRTTHRAILLDGDQRLSVVLEVEPSGRGQAEARPAETGSGSGQPQEGMAASRHDAVERSSEETPPAQLGREDDGDRRLMVPIDF